jgi:hypothetical protein
MIRSIQTTDPQTRLQPGTLVSGNSTIIGSDSTLFDVTSQTDVDRSATHVDGDLTVEGLCFVGQFHCATTMHLSDPASKDDLVDADEDKLADKMMALQIKTYRSKLDPGRRKQWGYSSRDVDKVADNLVGRCLATQCDAVDYNSLAVGTHALAKRNAKTIAALQKLVVDQAAAIEQLRKERMPQPPQSSVHK